MKKLAIVTSTRAEYGLLLPIIKQLRAKECNEFKTELVVTGTHLSDAFGYTVREIEKDNIRIDHRIVIPVNSSSELDISKNQAETLIKFTELFLSRRYSAVMILGDRYEMLSVAIAAGNTRTPIFHICGGDTTEGAIDEWIRHSITKISFLHFPSNEESKKRIIQMGEAPDRVFNVGSTSIDNILNFATMTKSDALRSIGLDECRFALCTYHPVTMEDDNTESQIEEFIKAIEHFFEFTFIVTKSNADFGGGKINKLLDEAEKRVPNIKVYTSLGMKRYLSLMKHAEFVLGNSSSGIIETPAFRVPTVNIGDRQKGRLQSANIINCKPDSLSIISAINKALSTNFRETCKNVVSPYGDGNAATKISQIALDVLFNKEIDIKKIFYQL